MINKFAFLLHDPGMLNHYYSIWKSMDLNSFSIVTTESFYVDSNGNKVPGLDRFFNLVEKEEYLVEKMSDLIDCGIMYDYVITNHIIAGNTKNIPPVSVSDKFKKLINRSLAVFNKKPVWKFNIDVNVFLPLQVGAKQIRIMYGADISDGWSLQAWNEAYDIFLCHGDNDQKSFKSRFEGDIFVMGYPRYDRFFDDDMDLTNIKNEFELDESKKTLLWMPTLGGEYSSIPFFAEPISELCNAYNVIVRPHPISFTQEPDFIRLLERYKFRIDRSVLRDMNELFSIADLVLPDYGGTPFSAIFLAKNIVFLDVPGGDSADINAGSSVLEIKAYLPVVSHKDIHEIDRLLISEDFYVENDKCVNDLFIKYFNSPRGGGAVRVANYFKTLLT